ncbi:OsmC family protein [Tenacibaculum jejuense]|uniref:OsmC family protein n=1 Tax=Tenacibaculum jejuense TaxID=584609 RepID=A0A238UDT9_9FLAO|nr:OsmC family protein [Tenacibaculum jejuense]SNR17176.1 OsmC family protein [Tenacibaculum jejuense]
MNIQLKNYNKHLLFEAKNQTGYSLLVGQTQDETSVNAIRPMELMLVSLASCSSIDVVKILNKQKVYDFDYNVSIDATRKEDEIPAIFQDITITYSFNGTVSSAKVKKATSLAVEKYCSVAKIIEQTAKINYKIILNNEEI